MAQFNLKEGKIGLIVYDLQKPFVKGPYAPPNSEKLIATIRSLIDAFRAKDLPVIYSTVFFRRDGADLGLVGEFFPHSKTMLNEDDEACQIVEELAPRKDDMIIRKAGTYSGFYNTALESICRNLRIDKLAITGGATNVGIDSLVRDAHSRGLRSIVLSDATFGIDIPDAGWGKIPADVVQKTYLSNIAMCLGQVMESADLLRALG
jgi:biuret amidohydrolase